MSSDSETIKTKIWHEVAESENPFAANTCYCAGFDVYGQLLTKASWIEYVYLLFKLEKPSQADRETLEALAIALANPGPRDHSVRAAMNAGVSGSTHASSLMAALAVGAGQLGGAREVALAMELWQICDMDLSLWRKQFELSSDPGVHAENADIWPAMEHPAGFDPNGINCPKPILQILQHLAQCSPGPRLAWLAEHRTELETISEFPLATTGVAAAALMDLQFSPSQGEMLFLILRLPGAAAHALEQQQYGWRQYPFFGKGLNLLDDPGPQTHSD